MRPTILDSDVLAVAQHMVNGTLLIEWHDLSDGGKKLALKEARLALEKAHDLGWRRAA